MSKKIAEPIHTGGTDSILSSLYRIILFNLNIDTTRFARLMEQYIIKSQIPLNSKESNSVRGNIKKELLSSKMSWKVFIKGLVFLDIRKFEIVIRLHHPNKMITEHSKVVVLTVQDGNNEETND